VREFFDNLASWVALGCEAAAILILAVGAIQIVVVLVLNAWRRGEVGLKKRAWSGFASWIVIALELTLAADVVRTAIAPTWTQIGQLGAIALIRTVLNLFLERDLESPLAKAPAQTAPPAARGTADADQA
jgi:uncharacterized membrane protein